MTKNACCKRVFYAILGPGKNNNKVRNNNMCQRKKTVNACHLTAVSANTSNLEAFSIFFNTVSSVLRFQYVHLTSETVNSVEPWCESITNSKFFCGWRILKNLIRLPCFWLHTTGPLLVPLCRNAVLLNRWFLPHIFYSTALKKQLNLQNSQVWFFKNYNCHKMFLFTS